MVTRSVSFVQQCYRAVMKSTLSKFFVCWDKELIPTVIAEVRYST